MQSGNFRNAAILLWLSLAGVVAIVGGCKKHVASVPPAQSDPGADRAADRNADRIAHHRESGSERKPDLVIHQRHGREHRPERGQSGGARLNSRYADRIDDVHDHGEWSRRHRDGHGARDRDRWRCCRTPTSGQPAGISELFEQNVRDAFFDFNKADIRPDARDALTKDAEFLRSYSYGSRNDRGSLRRARLDRVQPRPRPAARAGCEELSRLAGHFCRSDRHRQLGQRTAFLHGKHGRVLAAESSRTLRHGKVECAGEVECAGSDIEFLISNINAVVWDRNSA